MAGLGKKVWRHHPEECDNCGCDSEIFTHENLDDGWGYDGDPMRCTECGMTGYLSVGEYPDDCYVNWDWESI